MERALEILEILSKSPSVAFYEVLVAKSIKNILNDSKIVFIEDEFGNIIVELKGSNPEIPPIAFVAHMDHPGFEIESISGEKVMAAPLGGVPNSAISKGAQCFVLNESHERVSCVLTPTEDPSLRLVNVSGADNLEVGLPVFFDLEDFSVDEEFIYMRALDDLAGCAAIITALENVINSPLENSVYGVFTRAEEVGLIGARLLAQSNLLPLNTFVVSVETSSVIPGVTQNKGPVIRTGDASYTFDAQAEQILLMSRDLISKEDSSFKSQRHLMDAGSCEASAFMAYGYKATGIAFPLNNWHNASTEIKDPNSNITSESIGISDFINGTKLIEVAMDYGPFWEPNVVSDRYKKIDPMFIKRLKDD